MGRIHTAKDDAHVVAKDTPNYGNQSSADAALANMGYKSELPRNLGMMSILGLYVLHATCTLFYVSCANISLLGLGPLLSWLRLLV